MSAPGEEPVKAIEAHAAHVVKLQREDHARAGLVTHDEAREILRRFNASHWQHRRPIGSEVARYSIPANPRRDDDIRLGAYIARCRQLEAAAAEVLKRAKETGRGNATYLEPLVEFFNDPTWRRSQ